jgi:cytochrome o ubiquinol oxidase subunit 2
MKNVRTTLFVLLVAFAVIASIATAVHLSGASIPVLEPKGTIAREQKNLLIISILLMLIVVLPVFALTFGIAWKYRSTNTKAKFIPDWDSNKKLEALWWGIPCAIILALATITWVTSHTLDPFKTLSSKNEPVTVRVVALQWKWLFIYPENGVAAVNELHLPVGRPVTFEITSDAPMNSFWIPSLAGQVYAMSGMTTKLNVLADTVGEYRGSSANISGEGFAGMHFKVLVQSDADYHKWLFGASNSPVSLTRSEYDKFAKPSKDEPVKVYAASDPDLYDTIINKYMMPKADKASAASEMSPLDASHN